MKFFLVLFLFLSLISDKLSRASRVNTTVKEANNFYEAGHYQKAASLYQYLTDSLQIKDEALLINLAHATYLNGDKKKAQLYYTKLVKNPNSQIQSVALTQLGLLYFEKGNPERALYHFKKALIQNPLNEPACYNYELVKKYLAQNPSPVAPPKPNSPKSNKPDQNNSGAARPSETGNEGTTNDNSQTGENRNNRSSQSNSGEAKSGDKNQDELNKKLQAGNQNMASGGRGNTKGVSQEGAGSGDAPGTNMAKGGSEAITEQERQMQTLRARLRNTDLSPEKAAVLLEAMRQAELQYLQQVPKKATKQNSTNTPDW